MDVEQEEMQFLGVLGIFHESYKIIVTWRKIFTQITLSLILPLAFIFLAHIDVTQILMAKIITNETDMLDTEVGTRKYEKLSDVVASEWSAFFLIKAVYFTFLLIFSLLSTSAVVYTVACIYTCRDVEFLRIMSVVPRVWKRVMVTFLCTFLAFFAYNAVAVIVAVLWILIGIGFASLEAVDAVLALLFFAYVAGLTYMTLVWHLASVVSVLEDAWGLQAMNRSRNLMKGKMGIACVIFVILGLLSYAVQTAFQSLVVHASFGVVAKAGYAVWCYLLQVVLFLFGLVIQTVLYLVCKSYHHENIDKSALSDHLEIYLLGEYVPLKSKDVQLQQV